jgi:short-subunit dehydrogenase
MADSSRIVLITGASRGLGERLALHFAQKGYDLILTARSEEKLKSVAEAASAFGIRAVAIPVDLRSPSSLRDLANRLAGEHIEVDILLHNAADVTSKPFLETELEEIDSLVRTNVIGMLQLTRLLAPSLARHRKGIVIMISSLAGYKTNPSQTVYSISKAAVNAAADALAAELGPQGIHVMKVALPTIGESPGAVPFEQYTRRLDRAIARRESEVFLTFSSAWLMRLYRAFPSLKRLL